MQGHCVKMNVWQPTLVAVDGGAEEHQVGTQHRLDERQRDRRRLVDDQQLRRAQLRVVLRLDVLHRLHGKRQGKLVMLRSSSILAAVQSAALSCTWCCGWIYSTICTATRTTTFQGLLRVRGLSFTILELNAGQSIPRFQTALCAPNRCSAASGIVTLQPRVRTCRWLRNTLTRTMALPKAGLDDSTRS